VSVNMSHLRTVSFTIDEETLKEFDEFLRTLGIEIRGEGIRRAIRKVLKDRSFSGDEN